jgi:hypothetical protein
MLAVLALAVIIAVVAFVVGRRTPRSQPPAPERRVLSVDLRDRD